MEIEGEFTEPQPPRSEVDDVQSNVGFREVFAKDERAFTFRNHLFHPVEAVKEDLHVLFVRLLSLGEAYTSFDQLVLCWEPYQTQVEEPGIQTGLVDSIVDIVIHPLILLVNGLLEMGRQETATWLVRLLQFFGQEVVEFRVEHANDFRALIVDDRLKLLVP